MPLLDQLSFPITLFAALGSGLIGGSFFAFSNFVMKALANIPDEHGIRAMQGINVRVLNPLFFTFFLGTAAASVFLGITSMIHWHRPSAAFLLAGSVLYFVGNFVVTATCNVPRNNALARLDASDPHAVEAWRRYTKEWTRWNHVRTITALLAATLFIVALR